MLISRVMYENEIKAKEEQYLLELARKDEILLTTVCQFEDKIAELQEKTSVNNFDVAETPRVRSHMRLLSLLLMLTDFADFQRGPDPKLYNIRLREFY